MVARTPYARATTDQSLFLEHECLGVGELGQALGPVLDAHAGLLVPAERDVDAVDVDLVDPHGAGLQTQRDLVRLGLRAPYRATQAEAGVVGLGNGLIDV